MSGLRDSKEAPMKFGSDFSGMLTYLFCKTFSNLTVIETNLNKIAYKTCINI